MTIYNYKYDGVPYSTENILIVINVLFCNGENIIGAEIDIEGTDQKYTITEDDYNDFLRHIDDHKV